MQRALSVLGAICRYDESITGDLAQRTQDDGLDGVPPSELDFAVLPSVFERLFTDYLAKNDAQTKCAALRGLCGIFISHPREMLRMDQSGLISQVMAIEAPMSLQLESLTCWRDILLVSNETMDCLLFEYPLSLFMHYRRRKQESKVVKPKRRWIQRPV